ESVTIPRIWAWKLPWPLAMCRNGISKAKATISKVRIQRLDDFTHCTLSPPNQAVFRIVATRNFYFRMHWQVKIKAFLLFGSDGQARHLSLREFGQRTACAGAAAHRKVSKTHYPRHI